MAWLQSGVNYQFDPSEKLTIQDFEALCPAANRRSLQRDLKGMFDKKLIVEVGAGATDPPRHYVLAEL